AIYSLTENARSPFHAELAHFLEVSSTRDVGQSDWFVSRRDKDLLAASETASKLATPNFSTEVELLAATAGPRRTYLRRQADLFAKSSIFGFIAQVFESGIHWEMLQIVLTLIVGCLGRFALPSSARTAVLPRVKRCKSESVWKQLRRETVSK